MENSKLSRPLFVLNSDDRLLEILDQSNRYLAAHKDDLVRHIEACLWVYRCLLDLVPETINQIFSGHIFPLTEGEYELESSIGLCKLGFYKHAIGALRNVLELGWLSVYWDLHGQSHIDIQGWLRSVEQTPFRSEVFKKLRTNANIRTFDEKHSLLNDAEKLYHELCDFAHTKGVQYSIRALGRSNVNTFNEASVRKWLTLMWRVVQVVVALHVLKYPVGLQETPIDEKFGLNGPVGGFLRPAQAEGIRSLFPADVAATLQQISDNDPEARSMAMWVNEMPDITEAEFQEQIDASDHREIEAWRFEQWLKNQEQLAQATKDKMPEAYEKMLAHIERMRLWAAERGFLKSSITRTRPQCSPKEPCS